MHKKLNVDYLKSKFDKLPLVQLPKIKSRKIFSAKNSSENEPPPLPKFPPPTIVDRSPVRISTISALVEGAPEYDYSFGGAEIPKEFKERHLKEDEIEKKTESASKRTKGFSKKLTRHYKELTEFKFKNILGKKTIVRSTEIQVDMYKQRYEEEMDEHSSEQSDYDDFDVHSIPSGTNRKTSITPPMDMGDIISKVPQKAESIQNFNEIDPIDSTLYRIKRRAESIEIAPSVSVSNITPQKQVDSTKRSHRQVLDSACDRARKVVNAKLQKVLLLTSKTTMSSDKVPHPSESISPQNKSTSKKLNELSKQNSVGSSWESLNSSNEHGVNYNPRHNWTSQKMLSTDSTKIPHWPRSQLSLDSSDGENEIMVTRPAPPIPKILKPPNSPVTSSFNKAISLVQKPNNVPDFPKGHTRKPSMDSIDSDSWIPETYRSNRAQIGLIKIDENVEPWMTKPIENVKKLTKAQSIDIFSGEECEKVFEDFDDALKNVPVIAIPTNNLPTETPLTTTFKRRERPLVKQTSLTKQFSDEIEAENLNVNVNKLISRFEPTATNKTGKIEVIAVVETNRYHSTSRLPPPTIPLQERLLQPWVNSEKSTQLLNENDGMKKKRISAKEWAQRVKASRSIESGAQGSDETFYSFESGNYNEANSVLWKCSMC